MEGALGHPREDLHHRVRAVLVLHVDEVEHVRAIGHEDAAQEEIDEIHLSDDVHEVQHVAEEIPEEKKWSGYCITLPSWSKVDNIFAAKDLLESISIVHAPGLPEVADEVLHGVPVGLRVEGLAPQPRGDLVHLLVLEHLPEVVREVEHHALQNTCMSAMLRNAVNAFTLESV